MKIHSALLLVLTVFSASAIAADALPANHPAMDAKKPAQGAPTTQLPQKGKVISAIDVPNYTYLEVMQNMKTFWIAAPSVAVKKGDVVRFDQGMAMTNFQSKTLNRNFPSITFVGKAIVTKEKE
ncbi:MAG: NrfJ-related protein [Sterolibacterium sp.]|nr:NrfJ-related protein [Sterolibacterium sp.]